jgi:hypothetical protein
MLVELTMRRKSPCLSNNSPIDGIRILALLPKEWSKDLTQVDGDVIVRVHAEGIASGREIYSEAVRVLDDPAISHWSLVACVTCAGTSFGAKE